MQVKSVMPIVMVAIILMYLTQQMDQAVVMVHNTVNMVQLKFDVTLAHTCSL